jgi:dephospho-CoA kinase
MQKKIFVVVGMPGAGKSEVSRFCKEQGIAMFRTGDVIREEVVKRGLELVPENSEKIARQLREEQGMDVAARVTMEKAMKLPDRLVCLEGPRDMHELAYISKNSDMTLVVVKADDRARFERLVGRGKSGRDPGNTVRGNRNPRDAQEFEWRDQRELERGLKEVLGTRKYSRIVIDNNSTPDELKKRVLKLLEGLRE